MTTFNRTYRTPKFFLCVHTTAEYHIELEKAENRHTHYCTVMRGEGTLHVQRDGKFERINLPVDGKKKLVDVSDSINCNVVGESFENTKFICFNSPPPNATQFLKIKKIYPLALLNLSLIHI